MEWYTFLLLALGLLQTVGIAFAVLRVLQNERGAEVHPHAVVLWAVLVSLFVWSWWW